MALINLGKGGNLLMMLRMMKSSRDTLDTHFELLDRLLYCITLLYFASCINVVF
ncbi:hypothetical protein HanXRQr2_Chr08g0349641 [Helianthus annuus]|uniref:Uncharacterized protein n=1 Tax=Helianthus annuus TaxID=4232 RepID=A0A251TSI7_HELAN|nr:hypothetical protein HanXRQr2_Chr08g0349641 [Helianthus annuus]